MTRSRRSRVAETGGQDLDQHLPRTLGQSGETDHLAHDLNARDESAMTDPQANGERFIAVSGGIMSMLDIATC